LIEPDQSAISSWKFPFWKRKKKKDFNHRSQKQALNVVVMTEETEEKDMSSKSKQQKEYVKSASIHCVQIGLMGSPRKRFPLL
jgi:translation initiation factor IF-3